MVYRTLEKCRQEWIRKVFPDTVTIKLGPDGRVDVLRGKCKIHVKVSGTWLPLWISDHSHVLAR